MSAADVLRQAADMYVSREKLYGENLIIKQAEIVGLLLRDATFPMSRVATCRALHLSAVVGKLCRYAARLETGHQDSIRDAAVYAAMLEAFDADIETGGL